MGRQFDLPIPSLPTAPIGREAAALLERLACLAYVCGIGKPEWRRCEQFKPGDLVCEHSTAYDDSHDGNRIGVLVEQRGHSDFVLRLLSTFEEYTWTNAGMYRVLLLDAATEKEQEDAPLGTRREQGAQRPSEDCKPE